MSTAAPHPGKVLAHQLETVGVAPTELARQLYGPANRITQIINGQRGITGDSALRLTHWFGDDPEFWTSVQAQYELRVARAEAGMEIKATPTRTKLCTRNEPSRAHVGGIGNGRASKRLRIRWIHRKSTTGTPRSHA